jgi:hypothetical protein
VSLLAVALCLVAAAPAAADWETVGGGPVATGGSSLSTGPYSAYDYDLKRIGGTLYVAWTQSDGETMQIHVARLDSDGGSWVSAGGVVNADPAHDARDPSLAAAPDGTAWIAWDEQDSDGIRQVRVARFAAASGRWVEPDGRDWEINDLQGYPTEERQWFGAGLPRIAFLGSRPYVTFTQENLADSNLELVRLAPDGRSWERVAPSLGQGLAYGPHLAVIDGLLHVGLTGFGGSHPEDERLNRDGSWEEVGGGALNREVLDDYGDPREGSVRRIAGFGSEPYVLWTASRHGPTTDVGPTADVYVSHPVGNAWQLAGGSVGIGTTATSLRAIGGRLYAAWMTGPDSPAVHVSRLSDDGTSWIATPAIAGMPADRGAALSSLDGVPYLAWIKTDGATNQLVVERLDGAPDPIAPDDGEGSGPGTDPDVDATPILPPDDDTPPPAPRGACATTMPGTSGPDRLSAGSRSATIRGLAGDDRELGSGLRDCLFGNAGADVLRGGGGEDRLYGGAGADTILGGPDEDALTGGPGPDELSGGPGWDVFRGGPGNDTILAADGRGERVYCGPGNDTARLDRFDRPHGCEHVKVAKRRRR